MNDTDGYLSTEDGFRLYYRVIGDGLETVVIPSACFLWADLAPLAQGRRLIFYDSRGRGRSDAITDDSQIWTDYEVRDLESVRQHFSLEQTSLIGWSYLGGVVALYAADYPTYVKRLVMMCPVGPRSDAPYSDSETTQKIAQSRLDPAGVKRLEEMQQAGLEKTDPVRFCREVMQVYWPRQMGRPQALAQMKSDGCIFQNEWPQNLNEHWRKHFPASSWKRDWRDKVASALMPTLVIHGTEDLIPLESSREWATTLSNARLLVIQGSGHFPHLESPEVYFPAVNSFLAGEWPVGAQTVT